MKFFLRVRGGVRPWVLLAGLICFNLAGATTESNTDERLPQSNDIPEFQFKDQHEFWLRYNYEPGVTQRLLGEYYGAFELTREWLLRTDATLNSFEQLEPALLGFEISYGVPHVHDRVMQLTMGFQHERWTAWRALENRFELYSSFWVTRNLELAIGLALRCPFFNVDSFWNSFVFFDGNSELNYIYRIAWRFWEFESGWLTLTVADYDRMRLFTLLNVQFILRADYRLDPQMRLSFLASTGVKGASGSIHSFSQYNLGLGISYEL